MASPRTSGEVDRAHCWVRDLRAVHAPTGKGRKAPAVYPRSATVGRAQMTKHLVAGVAAIVFMSGVASAQTYPPLCPRRRRYPAPHQLRFPVRVRQPQRPSPRPRVGVTVRQRPKPASMNTGAQSPKRISTSKASRAARRPTSPERISCGLPPRRVAILLPRNSGAVNEFVGTFVGRKPPDHKLLPYQLATCGYPFRRRPAPPSPKTHWDR
jgi:hypothetical protein